MDTECGKEKKKETVFSPPIVRQRGTVGNSNLFFGRLFGWRLIPFEFSRSFVEYVSAREVRENKLDGRGRENALFAVGS